MNVLNSDMTLIKKVRFKGVRCFLILILFVKIQFLFAQNDVASEDNTQKKAYDKKQFKKILSKEFGNLFNPQSKNNLGNFASVAINNSEITFNGNSITKGGDVVGIKLSGGLTDGVFSIFSNSKFNSKLAVDVKYNFLSLEKQKLRYSATLFQQNQRDKKVIHDKHSKKLREIEVGDTILKSKILEIESQKLKLQKQVEISSLQKELIVTKRLIIEKMIKLENYLPKDELIEELKVWFKSKKKSKLIKYLSKDELIKEVETWFKEEKKSLHNCRNRIQRELEDIYKNTDYKLKEETKYSICDKKTKLLKLQFEDQKNRLDEEKSKKILQLEVHNLETKKRNLETEINLKNQISENLGAKIVILDKEVDALEADLEEYPSIKDDLIIDLNNWRAKELKKIENRVKVFGFKIKWWSTGFRIQNREFNKFNPEKAFEDQVVKKSFVSWEANIQYSIYNLSLTEFKSFYISSGFEFGYSDNFNTLEKVEVSERVNYGVNEDDRFSVKQFSAYTGNYVNNLNTLNLFTDYYGFLFQDNKAAIHIYPELKIKEKVKPSVNLGIGLMIAFKNQEDTANKINAELFVNFIDLRNSNDLSKELLDRSKIGLRLVFPIEFKSKT